MTKMKQWIAGILALVLCLGLSACSGGAAETADLTKSMDSMKAVLENKDMMDLTDADLMPNYGIDKELVKQFAVYVDSTGIKGDEIILLEGKDADAAKTLKEKLDARYKQKEAEMNGYLPEEYALLQKATVKQRGNFVSLIVSPQQEAMEKLYSDSFSK